MNARVQVITGRSPKTLDLLEYFRLTVVCTIQTHEGKHKHKGSRSVLCGGTDRLMKNRHRQRVDDASTCVDLRNRMGVISLLMGSVFIPG